MEGIVFSVAADSDGLIAIVKNGIEMRTRRE